MAGHPSGSQARLSALSLVRRLGVIALGGSLLAALFIWFQQYIGDVIFAFMMTLIFPIMIAPWLISTADRRHR